MNKYSLAPEAQGNATVIKSAATLQAQKQAIRLWELLLDLCKHCGWQSTRTITDDILEELMHGSRQTPSDLLVPLQVITPADSMIMFNTLLKISAMELDFHWLSAVISAASTQEPPSATLALARFDALVSVAENLRTCRLSARFPSIRRMGRCLQLRFGAALRSLLSEPVPTHRRASGNRAWAGPVQQARNNSEDAGRSRRRRQPVRVGQQETSKN
eukprot:354141-Chlamydomonas_euryale.AAC.6